MNIQEAKTIKSRKDKLSDFLKNHPVNYVLNDLELIDFRILFEKFYSVSSDEIKWNSKDIVSVSVIEHSQYKTKCFEARCGNIKAPLSIAKLAGSPKETLQSNIKRTMRNAINYQILEFRKENECNPDAILYGEKMGNDAHIDHKIPFIRLCNKFTELNKSDFNNNVIRYDEDLYCWTFIDLQLKEKWEIFHKKEAILRWLPKKINLKRGCDENKFNDD